LRRTELFGIVLVSAISSCLMVRFHDRSWIPVDEGQYAHVAERVQDGQVLNLDVEEFHPGAIHFVHALALRVFGRDLVSLRYPLAALTLLQSVLMYWLLRQKGFGVALVSGVIMSAVGFPQIANPTPGLYALFLTVLTVAWLAILPPRSDLRILVAGLLVMLVFLFRQLTGSFVGMGVISCLLWEHSAPEERSPAVLARGIVAIFFVALAGYLAIFTDFPGFLLYGAWPLVLLGFVWRQVQVADRRVLRGAAHFAAGMMVGLFPLLLYHLWNHSTGPWFRDVFLRSPSVLRLEHLDTPWLVYFTLGGAYELVFGGSPAAHANGIFWLLIPTLGALNGFLLVRRMAQGPRPDARAMILPFLAVFHALVTVFNQIPFYIYLSAGLSISSILSLVSRSRRVRMWTMGAASLGGLALFFHAGQPYTRTPDEVLQGIRRPLVKSELERCSMWIDPEENQLYSGVIALIKQNTAAEDAILVVPNDAELYFLSGRRNPSRSWSPSLSVLGDSEVEDFVEDLDSSPRLIIHNRESKYNTNATSALLRSLVSGYSRGSSVGPFDFYRRSEPKMP
jgi:hypothetical protein